MGDGATPKQGAKVWLRRNDQPARISETYQLAGLVVTEDGAKHTIGLFQMSTLK